MKKSSKEKSGKKTAKKKAHAAHKAGKASEPPDQLTGWPKIAKYLGQPVAVAQRWAKSGMPVERKGRSLTARPEDLSKWLGKKTGSTGPVHIAQSSDEDLLSDLRRALKQTRTTKRK